MSLKRIVLLNPNVKTSQNETVPYEPTIKSHLKNSNFAVLCGKMLFSQGRIWSHIREICNTIIYVFNTKHIITPLKVTLFSY